jgi:hypothetical protein
MSASFDKINLGINSIPSEVQFQILLEGAQRGSFDQLVLSNKQFANLAKEALNPRDSTGKPIQELGQKLEFLRAHEFITRKNSTLDKIPEWLRTDEKILMQARRFGLTNWWTWNDLDESKLIDSDFVLKTFLNRPDAIGHFALLLNDRPSLKRSFGIEPDEAVNQETIARMTDTQLKVWVFIYVIMIEYTGQEPEKNPFGVFFGRFTYQQSRGFIQKLVDLDLGVLNLFPLNTANAQDVQQLAVLVNQFPVCYQFLDRERRSIEEIALEAIRHRMISDIPHNLKIDTLFLRRAVQVNYRCLQHVPIEIRKDPVFMLGACSDDERCFQYASEDLKSDMNFLNSVVQFIKDPELRAKIDRKKQKLF